MATQRIEAVIAFFPICNRPGLVADHPWRTGEMSALTASFAGKSTKRDPEAALGWVTNQYEHLVAGCGQN